jgi:hypothetical protein
MCIYSLSLNEKVSKAKVGETLTRGEFKQHPVLLSEDGSPRCVRHGSELEVQNLQFDMNMIGNGPVIQSDSSHVSRKQLMAWQGQTVKVTLVHWTTGYNSYAADAFRLPDGTIVALYWVQAGVQMTRRRKVRKDKGVAKPRNLTKVLGLSDVQLGQVKADLPVENSTETVKS